MFTARSFLFLKSSVKLGINNLYCVLCGVTNMNDMDNSFLITTEIQRKWIEKFKAIGDTFKAKSEYNDQHSQFPYKNIEWLIKEGYGN